MGMENPKTTERGQMADDAGSKNIPTGCTLSQTKETALEKGSFDTYRASDSGKSNGEREVESHTTTSETLLQDTGSTSHPNRSKTLFTNKTFIKGCSFILGIKFNNPTVLDLLILLG